MAIGRDDPEWSSGEYFHGAVDEVRLWAVARTPKEIQTGMSSRLTGKERGLVGSWNFDNGTAEDQSGHGNNGVLKAGARVVEAARLAEISPERRVASAAEDHAVALKRRLETLEDLWRKMSEIYPALEYKGISGRT